MDLAFTPEEQAFHADVRDWVRRHLPPAIAHKVRNTLHHLGEVSSRMPETAGVFD